MPARELAQFTEKARQQALARYHILRPHLEENVSLTEVARQTGRSLRTLQDWLRRYKKWGLVGLARKPRRDQGQRQVIPPDMQQFIEGMVLRKPPLSKATIHRQVLVVAETQNWPKPSYPTVANVIAQMEPGLVTLAHEGTKKYQEQYDLLYRREATRPNEIWQADHSVLKIWLRNEKDEPAKPYLTAIEDDYSRAIVGYFLSFGAPSTIHTALALRQAIWRKANLKWTVCGIPEVFYTDHGSDFISAHMEQVGVQLEMRLVFSTAGQPRGRGRIERFFRTIHQLFISELPDYAPKGTPPSNPALTLEAFERLFQTFLVEKYHFRVHGETGECPQIRWEGEGFLPQMPDSLANLDLLLLTVAKTRRVRRDGIHFQNLRYMDITLAAYIGEDVVIRYDPRDITEIRVYHQNQFICRAVCQELAGETVSLKEIIRARNRHRRQLRQTIQERQSVVDALLSLRRQEVPDEAITEPREQTQPEKPTKPPLKRYYNE